MRNVARMGDNAEAPVADRWLPARLIPTGGIKGQQEQEARATSVLLAVLGAVPDFGHAILKPLGAPKGQIATYVEVPLKDNDGKVHRGYDLGLTDPELRGHLAVAFGFARAVVAKRRTGGRA